MGEDRNRTALAPSEPSGQRRSAARVTSPALALLHVCVLASVGHPALPVRAQTPVPPTAAPQPTDPVLPAPPSAGPVSGSPGDTVSLDPVLVDAAAARELGDRASPSSRNTIGSERIDQAALSGVTLGEFLAREVSGIFMRQGAQIGAQLCLEFRSGRADSGPCRPPQLVLDGIPIVDPMLTFASMSLGTIEQIQVFSPAEAGVAFGPSAGWGVIAVQTTTGPVMASGVLEARTDPLRMRLPYDWSSEATTHPSARVFIAAALGNSAGLAAGLAIASHCVELHERRVYRGERHCGVVPLMATGAALVVLPALAGTFSARLAGRTDRSAGVVRSSLLTALPVFIPGFALATLQAGEGGISGLEVAGVVLVTIGAPLMNTIADRRFRDPRP